MRHLTEHGWRLHGAGERVRCPASDTVLRRAHRYADKANGFDSNPPPRWEAGLEPPPQSERRPFISGRNCYAVILEVAEGITFIRCVPIDHSTTPPRFVHSETPQGCTRHTKLCPDCGNLLELISAPQPVARAHLDPRPAEVST